MVASQPANGTVTITGAVATYTPVANSNGSDSFTFKVNDGSADSAPAAVSMTVNPVNDAPVATADSYTTDMNSALVTAAPGVLANDNDIENTGLSAVLVSDVSNGTLTLGSDGGFTYTPATGFDGVDSFTYVASDGGLVSDPVTVTITVNPAGFAAWLDGFGLEAGANEDSDNDSISNAVEYVIGGNPANRPDAALLPTVNLISANLDGNPGDEDYLLFTYRRSDLAGADPNTTITVEWGTSLSGSWTPADGTHGEITRVVDVEGEDHDLVKVHIPRTHAANGGLFARLSVTITTP
jgi:hypothetical protein